MNCYFRVSSFLRFRLCRWVGGLRDDFVYMLCQSYRVEFTANNQISFHNTEIHKPLALISQKGVMPMCSYLLLFPRVLSANTNYTGYYLIYHNNNITTS